MRSLTCKDLAQKLTLCTSLSINQEVILDGSITEYRMTDLLPMSHYFVLVQGERDGHYTSVVTTEFNTGTAFYILANLSFQSIFI